MELYKKPVMEILELEKVDVLTGSCTCEFASTDNNPSDGICDICNKTVK